MVHQQHENHLQVGLDGETAAVTPGRQFRRGAGHQVERLGGNAGPGGNHVREAIVLHQEWHQVFDIVAGLFRAADEFGQEVEDGSFDRSSLERAHAV